MNIQLEVTKSERIQVTVPEHEVVKKAIEVIRKRNDIREQYWLDKSGYILQDDPDWRHGSISSIEVRPASRKDVEAFELIDNLNKLYSEITNG